MNWKKFWNIATNEDVLDALGCTKDQLLIALIRW